MISGQSCDIEELQFHFNITIQWGHLPSSLDTFLWSNLSFFKEPMRKNICPLWGCCVLPARRTSMSTLSGFQRLRGDPPAPRKWGTGGSHAFGNVRLIQLTKRSQIISKRLGRAMSKFNPSRVGSQYFDICYFSSSQGGVRTDCQDNRPHCPKTVPHGNTCRLPRKSFYKSEITTQPAYLRSGFTVWCDATASARPPGFRKCICDVHVYVSSWQCGRPQPENCNYLIYPLWYCTSCVWPPWPLTPSTTCPRPPHTTWCEHSCPIWHVDPRVKNTYVSARLRQLASPKPNHPSFQSNKEVRQPRCELSSIYNLEVLLQLVTLTLCDVSAWNRRFALWQVLWLCVCHTHMCV